MDSCALNLQGVAYNNPKVKIYPTVVFNNLDIWYLPFSQELADPDSQCFQSSNLQGT